MDDTLKRLLDAEVRAEQIARDAEKEQERVIQQAMQDARAAEERFRASIPELHRSHIDKATERAGQTVSELRRRYDERHVQLRDMAEAREEDALDAAFALLVNTDL